MIKECTMFSLCQTINLKDYFETVSHGILTIKKVYNFLFADNRSERLL